MATTGQRIFAGFFAALFLITSSGAVGLLIVQAFQNNKPSDGAASTASQDANKKLLQGTKLAGFTPEPSIKQLKTEDIKSGNGQVVKPGDTVTVDYTGAVAATGIIFQSSKDSGQPVAVALKGGPQGVIAGWVKGVPGMKVGGTRRLLIPAASGYGANPPPQSGIPANADLVFDVTVRKLGQ